MTTIPATVEDAWLPPPIMTSPLVRADALVTQVGQLMVPVVVIVPPLIGPVVAMELTVPLVFVCGFCNSMSVPS